MSKIEFTGVCVLITFVVFMFGRETSKNQFVRDYLRINTMLGYWTVGVMWFVCIWFWLFK